MSDGRVLVITVTVSRTLYQLENHQKYFTQNTLRVDEHFPTKSVCVSLQI